MTCNWAKEDPWRCCYNYSNLNELVNIATTWKFALQEATPQEAITIASISRKLVQDNGKRKIAENLEAEKSYKFKADPLIEKETLVVEAKRK